MGSAARALGRAARAARDRTLFAWRGFSSVDAIRTGSSAGEPGISTGFGSVTVFIPRAPYATAHQRLSGQGSTAAGWSEYLLSSGGLYWYAASSAPALVNAGSPIQLNASDYGRVHVHLGWHTGSALRHSAFRGQLSGIAAITGYTPFTGGHRIGHNDTTAEPASACDIIAHGTWRGVPTDADLLALYDYIRATDGQLPGTFGAMTMRFRWSVKRGLSGIATDGQIAPGIMYDESSGLGISRFGSTMQIRKLDVSREGRLSYGAQGFSATTRITCAGAGLTDNQPWWLTLLALPQAVHGGVIYHHYAGFSGDQPAVGGWSLFFSYNNEAAVNVALVGGGVATISGGPILATRAQRIVPLTVLWDGAFIRLLADGASFGASAAATYRAPLAGALPFSFGSNTSGGMYSPFFGWYGSAYGETAVSVAEVLAQHAEIASTGRIAAIAGKTHHMHDPTADVEANGGPSSGTPATFADRIGSDTAATVGALTLAQRTEHVWSYESEPISYASDGHSVTAYWQTATPGGIAGDPAGWHLNILWTPRSVIVPANERHIDSRATSVPIRGYVVYLSGPGTVLNFIANNGTGAWAAAPTTVVGTADIGKLLLSTFVFDAVAGKLRTLHKRVEVGTGTACAGYEAAATFLNVGNGSGTGAPLDCAAVLGLSGGRGAPTLAQYQALCDSCMASEDIQCVPGMDDHLWSVKQDVRENGGVMPALLRDRGALATPADDFARYGSPIAAPQYARAWGW